MGYVIDEAVIVTTFDERVVKAGIEFRETLDARERGILVGPIESLVNVYKTFFVAPDGSKQGWPDAARGKQIRDDFVRAIRASGGWGDVVRVRYGSDHAYPVASQ
jgi:hypothetical protein